MGCHEGGRAAVYAELAEEGALQVLHRPRRNAELRRGLPGGPAGPDGREDLALPRRQLDRVLARIGLGSFPGRADQSESHRVGDRVGLAVYVKLRENLLFVILHRARADTEHGGHLTRGVARADQAKHLLLTRGELGRATPDRADRPLALLDQVEQDPEPARVRDVHTCARLARALVVFQGVDMPETDHAD